MALVSQWRLKRGGCIGYAYQQWTSDEDSDEESVCWCMPRSAQFRACQIYGRRACEMHVIQRKGAVDLLLQIFCAQEETKT